ncbi:MAG: class I SAM-dependent methyltransferase [Gemmatimonadales bacterium]|nr:class I SAM-dependent methyltransferase [Gemmatimonadales bacterium]
MADARESFDYEREEDSKYSALYKEGYGAGPVARLLKWARSSGVELAGSKTIDCGCGRATLLTDHGIAFSRYVGVDISAYQIEKLKGAVARPEVRFVHGSLDDLPFEGGAFDFSWCCDVMEHIPPFRVGPMLREIIRVSDRSLFSISTRPSVILDAEGRNLHLTVKPRRWWMSRIDEYGDVVRSKNLWLKKACYFLVRRRS